MDNDLECQLLSLLRFSVVFRGNRNSYPTRTNEAAIFDQYVTYVDVCMYLVPQQYLRVQAMLAVCYLCGLCMYLISEQFLNVQAMLAVRLSRLSLLSARIICTHYHAIISGNFLNLNVFFKYSVLINLQILTRSNQYCLCHSYFSCKN